MSVNKKAKVLLEGRKVVTKWELLGIIVVFLVILYALFPKGKLEGYLLSENKNYDLAIRYLETLIKSYPQLKEFKIALLKFYIKKGNFEKALKLMEEMKNDEYYNSLNFDKIAYGFYKYLYFKTKNKKYLKIARNYLNRLLTLSASAENYEYVYNELVKLNLPDLQYKALKKLVKVNPSKNYLINLFNLAIYYKDYKTALSSLDKLYSIDKDRHWLEKKADIYLFVKKDVNKAVKVYLILFKTVKKEKLKTKYFLKAFYLLIWNRKYNLAKKISKKYENYFLYTRNKTVLKRILKFYLERGDLSLARNLSLKIMKIEGTI